MNPETIYRIQLALFISVYYPGNWTGLSLEQVAQYVYMQHVWATDNLYRLPQEGATVIIQSNAN